MCLSAFENLVTIMTEYNCHVCGDEFGSEKAIDSHIGQVHPEEFPWNDEEYIYREYIQKQKTRGTIADELGCSRATITNACERFGFEINREERQASYPELTNEDWLRNEYEDNGAPTIADRLGCTKTAVYGALERHGIERDDRHLDLPSGKNHPTWKGGHEENRGYTWPEQRKKALDRDNHKCRRCGMSNAEHTAEYNQAIHVHHIIRYGDFDSCEQANKLANLVTLCRPCHDELEGEPPEVVFAETDLKVKGDDPQEAVEKLNEVVSRLHNTSEDLRAMQPGEDDD